MTEVSSQYPPTTEPQGTGTEPADSTRPAWLPQKKAAAVNSEAQAAVKPAVKRGRRVRIVPVEEEPLTWKQALVRTVVGTLGVGFGISMLLHLLGIVGLAFWMIDFEQLMPEFVINSGTDRQGIEVDVDTTDPVSLSEKEGAPAVVEPKIFNPNELVTRNLEIEASIPAELENRLKQIAEKGAGKGNASGEGTGNSNGGLRKGGAAVGRNAVTKGKFTVWSVPADPEVEKPYLIGIRIQLPPKVKRFRVDDLTGSVSGDRDGHRQTIPHDAIHGPPMVRYRGRTINLRKKGYVPVRTEGGKKYATIYILVPGSKVPKTTDTIQIRSKMLRDEQRLKLVF